MISSVFLDRFRTILGNHYDMCIQAFQNERKGSFRLNTRFPVSEMLDEFAARDIAVTPFESIPWVYVFDRKYEYAIKGTRAFYDGKIYLQSIASLLPVLALGVQPQMRILDVCAAPGSKTTQMADSINNNGHIVAIEANTIRYDKLCYNVRLQGATCVEAIKSDARVYLDGAKQAGQQFDAILLDAPCSAEGRISLNNPKSYGFLSIENTHKKAELQKSLIQKALAVLAPGWVLVYSTCTLAPEENEDIVAFALKQDTSLMLAPIHIGLQNEHWWQPGLSEWQGTVYDTNIAQHTVRILPSTHTEGFFLAKIKKH